MLGLPTGGCRTGPRPNRVSGERTEGAANSDAGDHPSRENAHGLPTSKHLFMRRPKPKSPHQPNPAGSNPEKAEARRRRKRGLPDLNVRSAPEDSRTPEMDRVPSLSMTAGKA